PSRDCLGLLQKVTEKPEIHAKRSLFYKKEQRRGRSKPNSNFVSLPRNFLQKETKEMKAGLVPAKYNLCSLRCLLFKLLSPMHPLYKKADKLSSQVIGAAIEVH